MNALIALAAIFALMYALWGFFLAVMSLAHARDDKTLTPLAQTLGYPILFVGYVLDFIANMTVMTLVFLELPHEWLVTARISRHLKESIGRRRTIAVWFRDNWLDPFDHGHCD